MQQTMQQTMIVSSNQPSVSSTREDTIVVTTPLDAILRLEHPEGIRTVVLAGSCTTNGELAAFLSELYPSIRIEREV